MWSKLSLPVCGWTPWYYLASNIDSNYPTKGVCPSSPACFQGSSWQHSNCKQYQTVNSHHDANISLSSSHFTLQKQSPEASIHNRCAKFSSFTHFKTVTSHRSTRPTRIQPVRSNSFSDRQLHTDPALATAQHNASPGNARHEPPQYDYSPNMSAAPASKQSPVKPLAIS